MNYGIPEGSTMNLPVSKIDEESKSREKQMSAFTDKPEWAVLKEFLESRINYFQTYLPNGTPVADVPMEEVASRWVAANIIIQEFHSLISTYEGVAESVRTETP
jgi:hypothetical protein